MKYFNCEGFCRYLIQTGTDLDLGPDPALHLTLRKENSEIAIMLLQAGAEFEVKDSVSIVSFLLGIIN